MQEIGLRLDGKHIVIEGREENPLTLVNRIERVIVDAVTGEEEILPQHDDPSRSSTH